MQVVQPLRRATLRVVAVLLASIVCAGATGMGHTAWDDPACDPVPVHHDHNAHRISGGTLPSNDADDHCFLCHSMRLLRNGLVAQHVAAADTTQSATVLATDVVRAGRVLESSAPARAPPVTLL